MRGDQVDWRPYGRRRFDGSSVCGGPRRCRTCGLCTKQPQPCWRGRSIRQRICAIQLGGSDDADDLEELRTWLAVPSTVPGTSALVDTTTAITLTSLLSGEDRLTPLTLWDLSRVITAIICYDNLFHFAHREVDDETINRQLGDDVFHSLPLPSPGVGYDRQGVRGLFNRAWTDTQHLMDEFSSQVTMPRRRAAILGREVEHLARQWSIVLGRPLSASDVIVDADYEDVIHWASPGTDRPPDRFGTCREQRTKSMSGHGLSKAVRPRAN